MQAAVDTCPEKKRNKKKQGLKVETAAVDTCSERMHAVDAEAPRPLRIGTAVEF